MRFLLCVWFLVGGLAYAQAPALNYDVINNAPLAHVMRAGPVADASQTGFLKYVRDMNGRWKPGSTHEGVKGAFLPGLQANLWLPGGGDLVGSNHALDVRFDSPISCSLLSCRSVSVKPSSSGPRPGTESICENSSPQPLNSDRATNQVHGQPVEASP